MKSQGVSENINSSSSNQRKSSDFIQDLKCSENEIDLSSKENIHGTGNISSEGEFYNNEG